MCGLKLELDNSGIGSWWSHPAWVCGLKQRGFKAIRRVDESHPAWVCGLKQISWIVIIIIINVTPCVGVWIETFKRFRWVSRQHGHTLRGCVDWNMLIKLWRNVEWVTPCVGVWIETSWCCFCLVTEASHTLRGCVDWNTYRDLTNRYRVCHTLRGCVDWNRLSVEIHPDAECHTLRGCVDWNTQSTTIIARMNCHTLRGCIWIEALFTRWSSLWKNCKHSASCVFLFKLL